VSVEIESSNNIGTEAGAASSDEIEIATARIIGKAGVRSVEKASGADEICAELAGSLADYLLGAQIRLGLHNIGVGNFRSCLSAIECGRGAGSRSRSRSRVCSGTLCLHDLEPVH
jgi:hypothetical protein